MRDVSVQKNSFDVSKIGHRLCNFSGQRQDNNGLEKWLNQTRKKRL